MASTLDRIRAAAAAALHSIGDVKENIEDTPNAPSLVKGLHSPTWSVRFGIGTMQMIPEEQ